MPLFRIVGKTWNEGWRDGDVVELDAKASEVAVREGRLQPVDAGFLGPAFMEKYKRISGGSAVDSLEGKKKALEHMGRGYFFIDSDGLKELKENIDSLDRVASTPMVPDVGRVDVIVLTVKNDRDEAASCLKGILRCEYPFKITVYENSPNTMNTSKIWNKLIRESTCGYVMLIDSDADPENDFLTPMMEALHRHPDAAAIGPVTVGTASPDFQRLSYEDREEFVAPDHISGFCMLFNKEIFEKVGWFDEDFIFYGQDSDWMERVREMGLKTYVAPRAVVRHSNGLQGSVSSIRLLSEGKFNRTLDILYAKFLWKLKAYRRGAGNDKLSKGGLT